MVSHFWSDHDAGSKIKISRMKWAKELQFGLDQKYDVIFEISDAENPYVNTFSIEFSAKLKLSLFETDSWCESFISHKTTNHQFSYHCYSSFLNGQAQKKSLDFLFLSNLKNESFFEKQEQKKMQFHSYIFSLLTKMIGYLSGWFDLLICPAMDQHHMGLLPEMEPFKKGVFFRDGASFRNGVSFRDGAPFKMIRATS